MKTNLGFLVLTTLISLSCTTGKKIQITGALGDPGFRNIGYSYDGSYSLHWAKCYSTKLNKNSHALYKIPLSAVHNVKVLNIQHCCTERLSGTEVSVCDDSGYFCQLCENIRNTWNRQWASVQCFGHQGTTVKFLNPRNKFQACEVEIHGDVLSSNFSEIDSFVHRIKIIGSRGDAAWHEHMHTVIENSYDGSYSVDLNHCYIPGTDRNSFAEYSIAFSEVKLVKVLNRYEHPGRLTGTFVSVCDSATGRCQECGQTKYVGPGQWSPIQCPRGVQGNSVKFVTPNNFFQACEVEIFGEAAERPNIAGVPRIRKLEITSATGDAAWHGHTWTTIDKSYDGSYDVNRDQCYLPGSNKDSSRYSIDRSVVTSVSVLNRHDCCSERLTGTVISVCDNGGSCTECGRTEKAGPGQWVDVMCKQQVAGDFVKFVNPRDLFQACEVEIHGYDNDGAIEVTGCESSEVKNSSRGCDNMFDGSGSRFVKEGSCYVSKSNHYGWVEVKLKRVTEVGRVVLLPKGDGSGLIGATIEVCVNDKNSCQRFAKITSVNKDECSVISATAARGNMIRISINHSVLAICEMKIYPE